MSIRCRLVRHSTTLLWLFLCECSLISCFSPPRRLLIDGRNPCLRWFASPQKLRSVSSFKSDQPPLEISNDVSEDLPDLLDNLKIDPKSIEIVLQNTTDNKSTNFGFVPMFRGSANYIANHRSALAVYHLSGSIIEQPEIFRELMNDIALTWLLGMKIVIVAGCRDQVTKRVGERKRVNGLIVTDEDTLRIIKEEAGYVRFEIERQLARSLRLHGTMDGDGNVISGNFFSAQPFGVLNGTDYKFTGFVRRVEADRIRQLHASRDICLLSTLGVSPSGEVFNVNSEALAATVAGSLGANKIIYFTDQDVIIRSKGFGNQIQSLRLSDASNILKHWGIEMHKKGLTRGLENLIDDSIAQELLYKIGWAKAALEQGVKRAHILTLKQGALLQELYTRDGSGTLVSKDIYEGIRQANVNDVTGIFELISPLVKAGTLVDRPKAVLEKDIENYYVYTRDNLVVACGQLKKFEDGFAEIGCLVVRSEYRSGGRGDTMLGYLERLCLKIGCTKIFVLSTQTMEWFVERDFQEESVDKLPKSRQATYNSARASKIYMKLIDSDRELDASELW
eukprot:CAMPEP_0194220080 /NCGR_PEP_ID=MMETSP0156-20130528/27409_1 /TAXON_ID=33649 /ORGANISM="Thalassionema nitzschioides, Strain L26-B" /LENGTH=563 /DNA_ID=CAMNT_0038949963 /DNA_START=41 /DNA_END=1729 /DNA_ORIENTATION=-